MYQEYTNIAQSDKFVQKRLASSAYSIPFKYPAVVVRNKFLDNKNF